MIRELVFKTQGSDWFGIQNPVSVGNATFEGGYAFTIQLINIAIGFSATVTVAYIVWAAYVLVTSIGDPEKVQKGQGMITNAIIGLAICVFAYMIVNFALGLAVGFD